MIDPGEYILTILKPGYPQIIEEINAKRGSNQFKIKFTQASDQENQNQVSENKINNRYELPKNPSKAILPISKDSQISSGDFSHSQIVKPNKSPEAEQESGEKSQIKKERAKSGI